MDSDYIKKSHAVSLKENREKYIHEKIVYIKDKIPEEIDLDYVLEYIEKRLPAHLMHLIDAIYVGSFSFLEEKDVNAMYMDSAIYITNNQSSEEDMIDDIIHEIAHSVEELTGEILYFDGEIEREFLGKRKYLCSLLNSEGFKIPFESCLELEYDEHFDKFLYQNVGYEVLTSLTMGLFYSPYGATSLREYFANGFEHYFLGDKEYLKNISPVLYSKIINIANY